MRRWRSRVGIGLLLAAGACSGPNTAEQTLVAQNDSLGTQIADVQATATVVADRLQITLEYGQTAVAEVRRQNQLLAATVTALGQNPALVQPQVSTFVPMAPATQPAAQPPLPAQPGDTPVPAPAAQATPTPVPTLYNAVTAAAVGSNDCALGSVSSFTPDTERIYVVATAANIAPGMTLNSRWFREGAEVVAHDFTPDFAIEQACVWFFIDQTDTAFTPGSYSVQLEINGQTVGAPVVFTIVG